LEICFVDEKIERHGKVAGNDRRVWKGNIVGDFHHTTRRHGDIFGVAAPTINTDAFAIHAMAFIASKTCFACFTRRRRDHSDAIANVGRRDCGPDFYDFACRVGAEHMGQSDLYRIFAGADDAVERPVDRNRMDFDQGLAGRGFRLRQIFEAQHFRAAKFFEDDGFQVRIMDSPLRFLAQSRVEPRHASKRFDPMILPSQRFEETGLLQLVVDRRVHKLFGLVVFRSGIGFGHGCDDIFRGLEG
jgi:hypothetical protein